MLKEILFINGSKHSMDRNINQDVVCSAVNRIVSHGGVVLNATERRDFDLYSCINISFNKPNGRHQNLGVWCDDQDDSRVIKVIDLLCS